MGCLTTDGLRETFDVYRTRQSRLCLPFEELAQSLPTHLPAPVDRPEERRSARAGRVRTRRYAR
jgi:hypothetical protein